VIVGNRGAGKRTFVNKLYEISDTKFPFKSNIFVLTENES
jgi:hypothetical protein